MGNGKILLKSNIGGVKHLVILKYDVDEGQLLANLYGLFERVNCRFHLGETWFFRLDHDGDGRIECPASHNYFSVSMRLAQWQVYKSMLFQGGVNKEFRQRCLKAKGCILYIREGEAELVGHVLEKDVNALKEPMLDSSIRSSFLRSLFGGNVKYA